MLSGKVVFKTFLQICATGSPLGGRKWPKPVSVAADHPGPEPPRAPSPHRAEMQAHSQSSAQGSSTRGNTVSIYQAFLYKYWFINLGKTQGYRHIVCPCWLQRLRHTKKPHCLTCSRSNEENSPQPGLVSGCWAPGATLWLPGHTVLLHTTPSLF